MVTEVSSPEGTIAYQYSDKGYLVSVTNANGDVVRYTYDAYGNKASMTYPDGRTVSYSYDAMNRMTSVTSLDGEVTSYAYDAAGRRTETAPGSGTTASALTTTYSYDSVGNLLTQATSGASGITFSYSYNKNGYITGEKRTEDGKTTTSSYAYDPLGEITSFLQSTGYGETYAYDKAGNMTSKFITPTHAEGEEAQAVTLTMKYNKGNQLASMANGRDAISYSYDKNGSMVQKVLSSEQYGKLTDTYAYNALDQLSSYVGYDGYTQQFTYDANGMRLTKAEAGNGERSTLEELLRGDIAGLPEIIAPAETQTNDDAAAVPAELEWATTEYLYDITQEYYQVIEERTSGKNGNATTAYAYGLERIAAYTDSNTTRYVYDGRGSVAQTVTVDVAGNSVTAALPNVTVKVQSFSYTAFGKQMGEVKISGYGYNAELFDATAGMLYLRMRIYEIELMRFSQKDKAGVFILYPINYNEYVFSFNSPIRYADPSGLYTTDSGIEYSVVNGKIVIANESEFTFVELPETDSAGDHDLSMQTNPRFSEAINYEVHRLAEEAYQQYDNGNGSIELLASLGQFMEKNSSRLTADNLTLWTNVKKDIDNQEQARQEARISGSHSVNGVSTITEEYAGKTRLVSDCLLGLACSLTGRESTFVPTYLSYVKKGANGKIMYGNHEKSSTIPASYNELCMLQAVMEGWWYSNSGSTPYYGGGQCNFAINLGAWSWFNSSNKLTTTTKYLSGTGYTIGGKTTTLKADSIIDAPRGSLIYNDSLSHVALRGGEYISSDLQYYSSTAIQFASAKGQFDKTGAIVSDLTKNAAKKKVSQFNKYGIMKQIDMKK